MSDYLLDSANPQNLAQKSLGSAHNPPDFADFKMQNRTQKSQNLTPQEYAKVEEFVKMSFDFARNNDAESLKIMLENGLNPNLSNHKGDTLLMLASYHNAISCVRVLLDFSAEVDRANDRGHTPLAGVCFKGFLEVADLLLKAGANPNGAGGALTPINTAIMFRRKEILALLLSYNSKTLPLWKQIYTKCMRL